MKLRLRFRLLMKWYLGHFEEVRSLWRVQSQHEAAMRELHQDLARVTKERNAVLEACDKERDWHEESKAALRVMTDARLNADAHSSALQKTVTALSLSHEAAINNLKQTVDCFSLASCGRQVFGTAPSVTRQLDEQAQQPVQSGIQGRKLVQQETQDNMREAMEGYQTRLADFMREAEKRIKQGEALPGAQPEYSSTARAYSE